MNDNTVIVELEAVEAVLKVTSDLSGKEFELPLMCELYSTKFVKEFTDENDEKREVFDEEFPIDTKSETIDLEDAVVQAILLQEPIMKLAPDEEVEGDDHEMDYYDFEDEGEIGGRVTFS